MVTSNRTMEKWLPMMADRLLAQCAIDRLVPTVHEQFTAEPPGEPWESYYARRILGHFNAAVD